MGWPHPDFLTSVLSPDQLEEWARYFDEEPWGFTIEETRFVKLMSALGVKDLDSLKHKSQQPSPEPVAPGAVPQHVLEIQRFFGAQARHVPADESSPPDAVQ